MTERSRSNRFSRSNPPPPRVPLAELTPRQLLAIRMLARAGKTVSAVARELGVTRQTITRWKSDPRFAAELDRVHEVWSFPRNPAPQPPPPPLSQQPSSSASSSAAPRAPERRQREEDWWRSAASEVRDKR